MIKSKRIIKTIILIPLILIVSFIFLNIDVKSESDIARLRVARVGVLLYD